jgi:hypothetical protein
VDACVVVAALVIGLGIAILSAAATPATSSHPLATDGTIIVEN